MCCKKRLPGSLISVRCHLQQLLGWTVCAVPRPGVDEVRRSSPASSNLIWTSQARGSGVRAGAPGGQRGIHECECANEAAECPQCFVQGTFCLAAQKEEQAGLVSLHGVPLQAEPPCCQHEWPVMSVSPVSVSSVCLCVCVCVAMSTEDTGVGSIGSI